MDLFEKVKEIDPRLSKIKEIGVNPYFRVLESRQDTVVQMEGKRRIMLGSNNYLGLTVNEEIIAEAKKILDEYGTGCSGSRLLNGTLDMHVMLEYELAQFLNKEDVMTFSTGYMSNLGIISALIGRHDYIICDKENHASIYAGCLMSPGKMLRYEHNDMAGLKNCLEKVPENSGALIVTDGVFSMSGDIANLPEIVKLAKEYNARIMVDDAHALGVIGEGGRGSASFWGLEDDIDIYMGTFSKSLASLGGYMAAKKEVVDYVRHNSSPYIFSASMTPVNCAVALFALRHLRSNPQIVDNLSEITKYARNKFNQVGIKIKPSNISDITDKEVYIPIIPLYTYSEENTLRKNELIFKNGVYVNPVLPPACPLNECLLRTSYMATLTKDLIYEAIENIAEVWEM